MRRVLDFPPSRHTWSVRSEYSVVPQSRPSLLRAVRNTERNTEGIGCALSAGVNRRELPSLYLSANENENRPGTSEIFLYWYVVAMNAYTLLRAHSQSDPIHGRKGLSCSGVPLSDVWAMRRSRSSRRWMRCRMATTEWPLRRASSGQEMPSSLNALNNSRSSAGSHPLR